LKYICIYKSHASVYTREEIIKIFKNKLNRLKFLYNQQLLIINDKLIYNRKKYLLEKKANPNKNNNLNYMSNKQLNIKDDLVKFKINLMILYSNN
jgi:hypothetical protein